MATEYISRDAMHKANRYEWDGVCGDYDGHQIFIDNENMIDSIPAADVRPVVHAEWEQVMGKYDKLFRCSKCHFVPIEPHYFCQNCGADMREVKADGEG